MYMGLRAVWSTAQASKADHMNMETLVKWRDCCGEKGDGLLY
jgi:hypothetical protein